MTARSFPSPWTVVEGPGAFCVEDAEGGRIAWTYFDDDAGTGAMTREEAHRVAKAIAMVPEMRTIIRSLQDGLAQAEDDAPTA
ncbi:hypothetical protein ASG40_08910 [Methylobacterium sp. Leaf399]|uniref:hypothetical protein n=1 Tax=unclassified Methylobacterium TaxID=2615210 RepID=UPI0006F8DF8B|nr:MULTISPECIES: hypothetical protein [unclassified Methylobacterium]KQT09851.1 hypothetical protein ASG40_08910 [Methylobacterium sp. Leaf399]KQT78013.1 hypothetical protein ASG59_11395 [Methylobacterium sp. Leaf466]